MTEIFKILKYHSPQALYDSLNLGSNVNMLVVKKFKLEKSKHNFFVQAVHIWNLVTKYVFSNTAANDSGLIIPG